MKNKTEKRPFTTFQENACILMHRFPNSTWWARTQRLEPFSDSASACAVVRVSDWVQSGELAPSAEWEEVVQLSQGETRTSF